MSNAPAFPWFKVDLLSVANDLTDVKSLEGEGAYFRTLRHLWLNGPQPIADIAKRCKSSFPEVEHVFSACSTDVEPMFSIRWLEDQRSKAETGREKWKKAGEASAAARRAKSKKKPARSSSKAIDMNERSTDEEHTLNECSTNVEHSISTSSSISIQDSEKERANDYPSDFPPAMRTPEALEAWKTWEDSRNEKKKPLTPVSRRLQLADCQTWGTARAIAALLHSAKGNYQGLFEPKAAQARPQDNATRKNIVW